MWNIYIFLIKNKNLFVRIILIKSNFLSCPFLFNWKALEGGYGPALQTYTIFFLQTSIPLLLFFMSKIGTFLLLTIEGLNPGFSFFFFGFPDGLQRANRLSTKWCHVATRYLMKIRGIVLRIRISSKSFLHPPLLHALQS